MDYLARSSYLLQQGRFAADILYFYGEGSNLTSIFSHSAPALPVGFNFDYVNADAMIHELTVNGGNVHTKSGMSYRLIVLDPRSQRMSLPVLRALHRLVAEGAVVAGRKPTASPSLADDSVEFQRVSSEVFGTGNRVQVLGKGTVYAGSTAADAIKALRIDADFDYSKQHGNLPVRQLADHRDAQQVAFLYRKLADGIFISSIIAETKTPTSTPSSVSLDGCKCSHLESKCDLIRIRSGV